MKENEGCSLFCSSHYKAFGEPDTSSGCQTGDGGRRDCGHCKYCPGQGAACKDDPLKPCWCLSGNSGCPGDCRECNRSGGFSDGDCQDRADQCWKRCTCTVKCPCGFTVTASTSHDYFSGRTCMEKCREENYNYYCVKNKPYKGKIPCPPERPKNPCKKEKQDPCEKSCKCVNRHTDCGKTPPCPDGKKCTSLGGYSLLIDLDGGCLNSTSDQQGGYIHFMRECVMDNSQPGCDECDCNCENDCPDCHKCNSQGKCEYDPKCDEPCEKPCSNGACCEGNSQCVPGVRWLINDACHGNGGVVVVPAGVTLSLKQTAVIPASGAVCGRYHTHCSVVGSNGQTYGTHLDCQKGLKQLGPAGYSVCT